MFKNYFKIAWRNLLKNRVFSIINIVGLSLSVAFCLLLFFYIRNEQSFDEFHTKKNRLFRFEQTRLWPSDKSKNESVFSFLTKNDDVENQIVAPLIVGRDMQLNFPEVKSITRLSQKGEQLVWANKQIYKEKKVLVADDNFFNNFSFPIKKGDPKTALTSIDNVVISESIAQKYFGTTEAVGKTIELINQKGRILTVAAVAADAPSNSSIQFDIVLALTGDPDYESNILERFNRSGHLLFVELAEGVNAQQFERKIDNWSKSYFVAEESEWHKGFDFSTFHWSLRPLAKCHYNISNPWGHYTNAKNIYQLACLAIVILLIASLNYVLLTISNAAARSQEVGVRKVMGANRKMIVAQFWVETQILVVISVFTGLVLTKLLMPLFNRVVDTTIDINNIPWKEIAIASIILSFLLGLLAGYYPALLISRLKLVSIIKSFQTFKINPRFSKAIVVVQYTACVVLMVAAFVINRQMRYINNKDLGFDKEQVLIVSNPTWDNNFNRRMRSQLEHFAATHSYVSYFSGMNGGLIGAYNTNGFKLNGEQKWRKQLAVDYDYFEMLDLKFVQGRPFSRNFPTDSSSIQRSIVVNESLFKLMGDSIQLGQFCKQLRGVVIGVVRDYNIESLSRKIEPTEHILTKGYEQLFMFKIKAGKMQQAISDIEKVWKADSDNFPFEYTFLDQTIAKMYEADMRWQKTIQASCFFAIFIACMGLFGLTAINAANRTREIGIRKVLGASVKDIVGKLSLGFLMMVLISIVIATPIAWWMMNKWLEDFAYRIDIGWWMFAVVGLMALVIAFVTISIQAIKAAIANPVDTLRTE